MHGKVKKIRSMVWLALAICWVSASAAQLSLATNDNVQSIQAEQAATEVIAAHQMVEAMTDDLLLLIEAAQRYSADDKQRFFVELDDLLRPVIDFEIPFPERSWVGMCKERRKPACSQVKSNA